MTYVKFEHRHLGDDRWLHVSPSAFTVHVWALDHCNEQATDGAIPKARAKRLVCPVEPSDLPAAWSELLDVGFWIDDGENFACAEFTAHGIAADEQTATRTKWAQDKRRQRLHAVGNHQLCTPRSCKAAPMDPGTDVPMSTGDKWTIRPDQTRPLKGLGLGRCDRPPPAGQRTTPRPTSAPAATRADTTSKASASAAEVSAHDPPPRRRRHTASPNPRRRPRA